FAFEKTIANPETFLYNNLINTYGKLGNTTYALLLFDEIPQPNPFSWNIILSAYSDSGFLGKMQEVFNRMTTRDGVSWNSLISGYARHGSAMEAVEAYNLMLREGVFNLNRITFSTVLSLASSQGCGDLGRQVHGQIVKLGFGGYAFVGSPLVDMYAKLGYVHEAKRVFDEMPERNVVTYNTMIAGLLRCGMVEDSRRLFYGMKDKDSISWTTMVTGLMQNGLEEEAIDVFREMRLVGLAMDQYTFGSVLTACGGLMALGEGKQVHAFVIRSDYMQNVFVGSALLDMYCKCKCVQYAEAVFKRMSRKNVVSWTAMLVGYCQNGFSEEAIMMIELFDKMVDHGLEPDAVTFMAVLSACSRAGLVERGRQYFRSRIERYRIIPDREHYTCMIDSFSRGGRKGMRENGARKEPGYSWIKYKNKFLVFSADDQSSPFSDQIYAELEKLNQKMIEAGYVPDVSSVPHDVEESEKIKMLNHHSERLAIAFGLIFIPDSLPIRVVKSLRVCDDCHNATKYISKITQREILVRDAVRFHLYKDGTCSCGDFWCTPCNRAFKLVSAGAVRTSIRILYTNKEDMSVEVKAVEAAGGHAEPIKHPTNGNSWSLSNLVGFIHAPTFAGHMVLHDFIMLEEDNRAFLPPIIIIL
ncbi:hypothetical protein Tsubulata_037820, partial [Turnera subulata]